MLLWDSQYDSIEIIEEKEVVSDFFDRAIFAELKDNMQYQNWLRSFVILSISAINSLTIVTCDIRPDILAKQIAISLKS